jgi:serine/threonine-protein kinase
MEPEPPTTELIGGKYRLVRQIGKGGMGSVWEGEHVSLPKKVAVKFIETAYQGSESAKRRFRNEAHAAAQLASRHVVAIEDYDITRDGVPYIVMELLRGESLQARLDKVGRLPLPEIARILAQVARALGRAHAHEIVHRDLKPENIFLCTDADGDDDVVKVVDFGIAKFVNPGEGQNVGTQSGAIVGTLLYMSPEQARGVKEIDYRTDIWSMGVVAYRCAVGKAAFESPNAGDIIVSIVSGPPPVPSAEAPDLPAAFDAWFARATAREPKDRFASAADAARALAEACGVVPIESARPSDLAPAASVRSDGASVAGPQRRTASGAYASTLAEPDAGKGRRLLVAAIAAGVIVLGAGGALLATRGLGSGTAPVPSAPEPRPAVVAAVASAASPADAAMDAQALAPAEPTASASGTSARPGADAAAGPRTRPRVPQGGGGPSSVATDPGY